MSYAEWQFNTFIDLINNWIDVYNPQIHSIIYDIITYLNRWMKGKILNLLIKELVTEDFTLIPFSIYVSIIT